MTGRATLPPASLGTLPRRTPRPPVRNLEETVFAGFYPALHDRRAGARDWLASYCQTYVERDVRNLLHIGDLEAFSRFLRLCAGRNAQILNLSSLASDCGVTHPTARRWISVLEASFLVTLLRPHHRNFGKRLIRSPKIYFLDTGLLCYLLGIRGARDLATHASRGAVFESFVLSEIWKGFLHRGEPPPVFFWRDSAGHEVDFLLDLGNRLVAVEAKSARTLPGDALDGLRRWRALAGKSASAAALVHGGDAAYLRDGVAILPWFAV